MILSCGQICESSLEGYAIHDAVFNVRHFLQNECSSKRNIFSCNGKVLGKMIVLLPPATKLRQGNVFTPVCHSVHRGCLTDTPGQTAPPPWQTALGRHPLDRPRRQTPPGQTVPGQTPPWAETPRQTPPSAQCMLGYTPLPLYSACWDTVNKRAVRILLECILAFNRKSSYDMHQYMQFLLFLTSVQHYLLCTKQNMCHLFPCNRVVEINQFKLIYIVSGVAVPSFKGNE